MLSPLSLANQTPDPVTDSDISDLQTEAGEAGDRDVRDLVGSGSAAGEKVAGVELMWSRLSRW